MSTDWERHRGRFNGSKCLEKLFGSLLAPRMTEMRPRARRKLSWLICVAAVLLLSYCIVPDGSVLHGHVEDLSPSQDVAKENVALAEAEARVAALESRLNVLHAEQQTAIDAQNKVDDLVQENPLQTWRQIWQIAGAELKRQLKEATMTKAEAEAARLAKTKSTAWQHTNAANRSWPRVNHHRSWPRVCQQPLHLPPDYVRIVGAMSKRAQAHWTQTGKKQRGDIWAAKFGKHSGGKRQQATIGQLAHLQACLYQTLDAWTELARAFKIRWAAGGGTLFGALCYHSMPLWDDDMDITVTPNDCKLLDRIWETATPVGRDSWPHPRLDGWEPRRLSHLNLTVWKTSKGAAAKNFHRCHNPCFSGCQPCSPFSAFCSAANLQCICP